MNELDRAHLLEVKGWAEREIEKIEIRRANAPMWDGYRRDTGHLLTNKIPNLMAGPHAALRESVLKLEKTLRESDERRSQAEEERRQRLVQARAHTDALREWLEALS